MKTSFLLVLLFLSTIAGAADDDFTQMPAVQAFVAEMHLRHGFDEGQLLQRFAGVKPLASVLKAIQPPLDPGIKSWQAYRTRYVEAKRIALGLAFWRRHGLALKRAEARYGVPPEVIVAIIGVETIYGRHLGQYNVFAALATLAFRYPPRAELFGRELEELLLLARESTSDPMAYRGSYAGAIGLPQFMPSSVRRFAIDGDGDGHIDLMTSPNDAIASVGNFLAAHGWQTGEPIANAASVAGDRIDELLAEGIAPKRLPSELAAFGVTAEGAPEMPAAVVDLVTPQQATEYRLGYRNFYVITRYNRSSFYAMAVNDLAEALRRRHDSELQQ